ncbi:YnaM/YnfT family protein [Escherichia coli]|nr:YnaM/YnfT family protein [Escherichia coli]
MVVWRFRGPVYALIKLGIGISNNPDKTDV